MNPDADPRTARPEESPTRAPPPWFVERANVADPGVRERFAAEWPDCWEAAAELLSWETPPGTVLAREGRALRWFEDGVLNACYNCVDRHVEAGRKNAAAIRWEGRAGETRTYTYLDLMREVNEVAAALRSLGVGEGDVVTLFMPVMPELPITMLACARLGALHNVVYAGFSAREVATRLERTDSRYLVTCDSYYRRGSAVNQKTKADNARHAVDHDVETVVVRRSEDTYLSPDHYDYRDLVSAEAGARVEPIRRDAPDPLFVIYTSGTTGEPRRVIHTTGGYLAYVAWTARAVLDVKPEDTYWCAADIAWITGHSYNVYGPLALGTTTLLYEGAPDQQERDQLWELVERHAVDVFYTAPTAIRSFVKWGSRHPRSHDLSSLRLLGSVGEPIDPRTWRWYRENVGGGECPIVDTWWQTETGGIVASTLPGVDEMRPGAAGPPLPGLDVAVVDEDGAPLGTGEAGLLAVTRPWPGMPRSLTSEAGTDGWQYVTGDRAVVDDDGYVTLLGRADDTVGLRGREVGATSLEEAIVELDGVAEAAVVQADGTAEVTAFVSPEHDHTADAELRRLVVDAIGDRFGLPDRGPTVIPTRELPKTHSGKVMRRLLSALVSGEDYGDTSGLRNPETVGEIEMVARSLAEGDD